MVLADSFYYQPVQIDTINTRVNADLFAKEGDANGRGMVVQITENGIIKDTTGITLRLQWSHISVGVSGFTDFEVVDATKGLYKLIYPTSMFHRGRVEAFIRITDNGRLSGTRNLLITVERMVASDETIEAADDFSALQTALTRLSAWEATISGKVDTWDTDMEATKQLYIDTLNDAEAAYPQELISLHGQLADNMQLSEQNSLLSANLFGNAGVSHVMCGVDSLTNGAGGSKYLDYFRPKMYSQFEYGGPGYMAFENETQVTDSAFFSMGFTQFTYLSVETPGQYPAMYSLDNKGIHVTNGVGATADFEIKTKWAKGKLFYLIQPDGGSFTVSYLNDSTDTTQNISCAGTLALGVVTLADNTSARAGKIAVRGVTGKVVLFGGYFTNESGVAVSRIGKGGDKLEWHNQTDSTFRSAWLSVLKPDLLILNAGTNDSLSGEPFTTALDQYTTPFVSVGTELLLVRPHDMSNGWSKNDETLSFAKTKKYSLLNLQKILGNTYTEAVSNGFMLDTVHTNVAGNKKISNAILKYLGIPTLNVEKTLTFPVAVTEKMFVYKLKDVVKTGHATNATYAQIYDIGLMGAGGGVNTYGMIELTIRGQVDNANGYDIVTKKAVFPIQNTTTVDSQATVDVAKLKLIDEYNLSGTTGINFEVVLENLNNRVLVKIKTNIAGWINYNVTGVYYGTKQNYNGYAVTKN